MESFFRYIAYVDYYEKGLRLHNAGYLRWRMTGLKHQLELEIKDAGMESGFYSIREEESKKELSSIQLIKGQGSLKEAFEAVETGGGLYIQLDEGSLDLYQITALRIELTPERILRIPIELPLPAYKKSIAPPLIEPEEKKTEPIIKSAAGRAEKEEPIAEAAGEEKRKTASSGTAREKQREEPVVHLPLQEDKWEQLCRSYPQVHPFGNGRVFLTIHPKDFIILQENYQKLVNNSFLLHGYYHYGHMILGKLESGENKPYYIGVPGVFYEKEKQAAGLFGFAGFEGTENPVKNGSYGYYMIEVKL
ncbi:MAG: DUF6128 domain-containing protein [Lachnospiraceae bacterium]